MERELARTGGVMARLNFNSAVAIAVMALGILIWVLVPYQVAEPPSFFGRSSVGISPKLFPQLIAIGMIFIGACYFYASLSMQQINGFSGLPVSAYVNLAVVLAAMLAYVALLRPLGYVATSMGVATAISFYYGSRNLVGIGLTGIAAPLAIYYLFTRFLSVSLPPVPWG